MKQQWQDMSDKFSQLTTREQLLLLGVGLVAIFFIISYLFIDDKSEKIITFDKKSREMVLGNQTLTYSIDEYQRALKKDPDKGTAKSIFQLEAKLAEIDNKLVHLTTDLISPIEMREALLRLLKLEPGVSLLSFELTGAKPLLDFEKPVGDSPEAHIAPTPEQQGLNLYKHGIKIKLSGKYFQLRNYLQQLEQLSWTFFWQDFQFEVTEYPQSEVEITIYSLGLNKEFIGV